ncbi:malectin domain-containing carbohydrate-binding protein [Mucilaginibacter sp.]|uniref:malectin domain-containing carbohydrate-binding protein n=1 Tax=Mucilaginibacter sp. TaxID=1882438 RepID=UPI0026258561|nr:malectin domain-containing carbohydrate-binding protein [Mucilaginibacter sp.]
MKKINYPAFGILNLHKICFILAFLCLFCRHAYCIAGFGTSKNESNKPFIHHNTMLADPCSPISTLPCSSLLVSLPFNLTFNATGAIFASIFATHRNALTALTYNFDDFSVISMPVAASTNIDFLPGGNPVPAGFIGDTGLPYDSTRKFGWIDPVTKQPVSLEANMRIRTGTTDAKLRSLVAMQANTNNQHPGTWEYSVPNGKYTVTVSAGDDGYYDSDHQLNVEGLPTISDFRPSSSNKHRSGIATVQVSDGKLTIDATGGINTKMNYLTFTPATTVADTQPPTASLRLVGALKSPGVYNDQAQVFITANDLGGSGLTSLQYSINNGTYINYTKPFVISTAGNYSIKVKAADANNNQKITNAYTFTVSQTTGAMMVLNNPDAFPANDHLVFSFIQIPWRRTSPDTTAYNANHSKVKLRISNKGTGKLTVSNLTLSNSLAWKIVSVNSDTTGKMPVGIVPAAFADVTIQFIARNAATRLKVFNDTLTIVSNDSINPVKKVTLSGIWQAAGESTNEPYAQQIISAFGFATITGYGHDDGDINGTTRVPNSSEVNAAYFVIADPSRPVTVHQMAAYHGCCSAVESFTYFAKGSSTITTLFTHTYFDGQSVLPRFTNTTKGPAQGTFTPTGAVGFKIGSSYSDRTKNFNGLIGIRFLKVYRADGNIVPNAYIMDCDYLGTSATNYDYQDNIYYVENIKPDSGSLHYSELAALPNTAINFKPTLTGSSNSFIVTLKNQGKTYPDGTGDSPIQLKSAAIVGPNAAEFTVSALKTFNLAEQATTTLTVKFNPASVGIKNAALVVKYNNALSPLRVPLYGIANNTTSTVNVIKRIKGGSDVNLTIGNNLYVSDMAYRKGSVRLDHQTIISNVAGTDIDSLYVTYLSALTDNAETSYEIPVTNGNYLVRMHFVENYWTTAGSRIFNTTLENKLVLQNFDIYSEVGYRAALVKDFNTTVSDGVLNIKFNPTANRVALAGLELFQVTNTSSLFASELTNESFIEKGSKKKITVFPNPNSGSTFYLSASNYAKHESVLLSITNMSGRLLQTQKFITDDQGMASTFVTFYNKLSKGIYIINAKSSSGNLYSKLLVE